MTDWTLTVVDTLKIKGKPPNWFPSAEALVRIGVPLKIARQWKRERYEMTTGLKRRLKQNRN
jgi:hypothetical protein